MLLNYYCLIYYSKYILVSNKISGYIIPFNKNINKIYTKHSIIYMDVQKKSVCIKLKSLFICAEEPDTTLNHYYTQMLPSLMVTYSATLISVTIFVCF